MLKVQYYDHMGDDLKVVNMARASFDKRSDWVMKKETRTEIHSLLGELPYDVEVKTLSQRDKDLIFFLARGMPRKDYDAIIQRLVNANDHDTVIQLVKELDADKHWAPFAHCQITLYVEAPIPIARQMFKHKIGMVESEVSRRYVSDEPDVFQPDVWRSRPDNIKQGSSDIPVDLSPIMNMEGPNGCVKMPDEVVSDAIETYNAMIELGVTPEQARFNLPQGMMTSWYWTGSLVSFARVIKQRSSSHAQFEARTIANQIRDIITPLYPISMEALLA
jgi:thymidylate synthase (FAD)